MTDEKRDLEPTELTEQELAAQDAEQLPDREAMSLINANVAVPVNAAVAANVLSDNATSIADATQDAQFDQSNVAPADSTTP